MEIVRRSATEGKSVAISARAPVQKTVLAARKSVLLSVHTQDAHYPAKSFVSFALNHAKTIANTANALRSAMNHAIDSLVCRDVKRKSLTVNTSASDCVVTHAQRSVGFASLSMKPLRHSSALKTTLKLALFSLTVVTPLRLAPWITT